MLEPSIVLLSEAATDVGVNSFVLERKGPFPRLSLEELEPVSLLNEVTLPEAGVT
jgi:hypothetical protein